MGARPLQQAVPRAPQGGRYTWGAPERRPHQPVCLEQRHMHMPRVVCWPQSPQCPKPLSGGHLFQFGQPQARDPLPVAVWRRQTAPVALLVPDQVRWERYSASGPGAQPSVGVWGVGGQAVPRTGTTHGLYPRWQPCCTKRSLLHGCPCGDEACEDEGASTQRQQCFGCSGTSQPCAGCGRTPGFQSS